MFLFGKSRLFLPSAAPAILKPGPTALLRVEEQIGALAGLRFCRPRAKRRVENFTPLLCTSCASMKNRGIGLQGDCPHRCPDHVIAMASAKVKQCLTRTPRAQTPSCPALSHPRFKNPQWQCLFARCRSFLSSWAVRTARPKRIALSL